MANYSSAEKALLDAVPTLMLATYQQKGRIRCHKTTYTSTGTFGIGDTITGAPLPKGAKIIRGYLASDIATASVTLKVTINAVDILAATSFAAAAIAQIPDAAGAIAGPFADLDCGGYSPIITSGGATFVSGKKIVLYLEYVVD